MEKYKQPQKIIKQLKTERNIQGVVTRTFVYTNKERSGCKPATTYGEHNIALPTGSPGF